jgi:hypothetical protein
MAEAVSIPSAELVQEFLTDKGKEVIKKMFYGFESAAMVRKFDGVTDKLILADQDVTTDLIREWNATMSTTDDAIEVSEVKLEVAQLKTELKFILRSETMRAYKAYLKGAGISTDDMNIVEYLIQQPIEKQMQEMEDAMWQGEEQSSGIGTRKLIERINGFRFLANAAATAGNGTVVTTGAITSSNAVTKVQDFYKAAHKTMKNKGMHIFCSYAVFEAYQEHLLTLHASADQQIQEVKGMGYTLQGIKLRLGAGRSFLVPVPGMGDDDFLIGTRSEFLAYGFDYESEWTNWDIQKHGWETWALNAFPMGVQILLKKPGFLLVNDRY